MANPIVVTTFAEFQTALLQADAFAADTGAIEIDIQGTIAETADPTAVNLKSGNTLLIKGVNGATLDGHDPTDGATFHRGLFVYQGNVTIQDLTIENAHALGGAGGDASRGDAYAAGGGGAGLGGGLFVAGTGTAGTGTGGKVTLLNVVFNQNQAIGGTGGASGTGGGAYTAGGGGLGGNGGSAGTINDARGFGGGGGIGSAATGGGPGGSAAPGAGIVPVSTSSSPNSGGGGTGTGSSVGGGLGGGIGASGSTGGFGGGGGYEGDGGFGGGGGGTDYRTSSRADSGGGDGGFGGGGGGFINFGSRSGIATAGGFGGGAGGNSRNAAGGVGADGGGGLGAGGDIFVQQGGTLTILGTSAMSNGSVTAGAGGMDTVGGDPGKAGQAFASGIYFQGNNSLTFNTSGVQTINDVIGDDTGSAAAAGYGGAPAYGGKPGYIEGSISVVKAGSGTLTLGAANTYSGGLTITGGSVNAAVAGAVGSGAVSFEATESATSTLSLDTGAPFFGGTVVFTNPLHDFSTNDGLDLRDLLYTPTGQATVSDNTLNVTGFFQSASFNLIGDQASTYYVNDDGNDGSYVTAGADGLISHSPGTTYDPVESLSSLLTTYAGPDVSYTVAPTSSDATGTALTIGHGSQTETFNFSGATALNLDFSSNNAAVNLTGGAYNDVLEGGAGADMIDGGTGNNTVSYANSSAGVSVNLNTTSGVAQVSGGSASGDMLTNIQNIIGSNYNDILIGNTSNSLYGGVGNDVLRTQGTPTLVDGGAGIDTLSVSKTAQLTDANFANIERVIVISGGHVDMSGIDSNVTGGIPKLIRSQSVAGTQAVIIGTMGNDVIAAGRGNDSITGGLGNDRLSGSTGDTTFNGSGGGDGNDVMFAGLGQDTFNELMSGFGRDVVYKANMSTDYFNVAGLGSHFHLASLNGGMDTLIYGDAGRGAGSDLLVLKGITLSVAQEAQANGHIFSAQST